MKCKYCADGCDFMGRVDDVLQHEITCGYSKFSNSPDGKTYRNLLVDSNGLSTMKCELGCNGDLKEFEQPYHTCISYLKDQAKKLDREYHTMENNLVMA